MKAEKNVDGDIVIDHHASEATSNLVIQAKNSSREVNAMGNVVLWDRVHNYSSNLLAIAECGVPCLAGCLVNGGVWLGI